MTARFTHIALPCHDLEATIGWYETHTSLRMTHRRTDPDGDVAWVTSEHDSMALVFVQPKDSKDPSPILTPFAHLGFSLDSPEHVDEVAENGRQAGCLAWEPTSHPPPVGYLCALADPDGNLVEFSFGQEL
ncbi:MAG: VOC family protein [Acidimicrobiales bacterium]|nr:VOC family protein [Acidimicrobiales bacterium]|tara:strand:+ start:46 stop:438 length:393 start_codon:yes stop_codon:yes gene_type:complete